MSEKTKLTFLGTGTSQGVPVISCRCRVCTSADSHDKRLRSSVMVESCGVRVVIDAGPDFRQQMLREKVSAIDGILLTHEHKDHIGGLDDVRAFNYTSGKAVEIYATERVQRAVMKDFDYAFGEHRYPGVPDIDLVTIDGDTPFRVKSMDVVPVKGVHYKMPVLGFRMGNMAYLTDFNHIDDDQVAKLFGVEVLVVNALRQTEHLSHFTLSEALELARKVGAPRTCITHISDGMGLHSEVGALLPDGVMLAWDGLSLEV